jgi:hypothetical protein
MRRSNDTAARCTLQPRTTKERFVCRPVLTNHRGRGKKLVSLIAYLSKPYRSQREMKV